MSGGDSPGVGNSGAQTIREEDLNMRYLCRTEVRSSISTREPGEKDIKSDVTEVTNGLGRTKKMPRQIRRKPVGVFELWVSSDWFLFRRLCKSVPSCASVQPD